MPRKVDPRLLLERRLERDVRRVKAKISARLRERGLRKARMELEQGLRGSVFCGLDALTADSDPEAEQLLHRLIVTLSGFYEFQIDIPEDFEPLQPIRYVVEPLRPRPGRRVSARGERWKAVLAEFIADLPPVHENLEFPPPRIDLAARAKWYLKERGHRLDVRTIRRALVAIQSLREHAHGFVPELLSNIDWHDRQPRVTPRNAFDRMWEADRRRPRAERLRERLERTLLLESRNSPDVIKAATMLAIRDCLGENRDMAKRRRYRGPRNRQDGPASLGAGDDRKQR